MKLILVILVLSSVAVFESHGQCTTVGLSCASNDFCNNRELIFCNSTAATANQTILPCPANQFCRTRSATDLTFSRCALDLTKTCPASANGFICDNVGIYPNPSDCTSFYKCSYDTAGFVVAELKTCFTGYVFNGLVSGFCTPRIGNLNCLTLTCPTTGGTQFVRFGNTLRYYALCSPLLPAPLVKACPVGSIFKPSANRQCEFKCPGFGNFAHSEDTQKYFTCIFVPGVGFRGEEQSCGPREIYNETRRRCVKNTN